MNGNSYEMIIWSSDEDAASVVGVPELPGCMAHGVPLLISRCGSQTDRYSFVRMEITLPSDLEAYVEGRLRESAFTSANEFIREAVRRKMEADAWMAQGCWRLIKPNFLHSPQKIRNQSAA